MGASPAVHYRGGSGSFPILAVPSRCQPALRRRLVRQEVLSGAGGFQGFGWHSGAKPWSSIRLGILAEGVLYFGGRYSVAVGQHRVQRYLVVFLGQVFGHDGDADGMALNLSRKVPVVATSPKALGSTEETAQVR